MRINILFGFLLLLATDSFSQKFIWENKRFELVNTKYEIVEMDGSKVLKLERDLTAAPFDEKNIDASVDGPTYAKLLDFEMENGVIEVKVLSRIMEKSPFPAARGFIGAGFWIDAGNKHFDGIYVRPANGRADDQLRRNHSVQYFSYPDYGFNRLRKEANGLYETYADIELNEWIDLRIEIENKKAKLFINQQKSPSFIVNETLGVSHSGNVALWVEVGTIGYFKDFKVTKKKCLPFLLPFQKHQKRTDQSQENNQFTVVQVVNTAYNTDTQ